MHRFVLFTFSLLVMVISPLMALGQPLLTSGLMLTEQQIKNLENEKIVLVIEERADDDILVKAFILFNKSLKASWEIMANSEDQQSYIKNITELKIIHISETEEHVEYVIQWLFIRKKFKLIHYKDKTNYYMNWYLDPKYDNQLKEHTGYWQLYEYPGNRTLAEYADSMAMAGLPRWLENLVKKEVVKKTMYDIKQYLDSMD